MKQLIQIVILSIFIVGCSKEEDKTDYAKLVTVKYKTKTLNSNGTFVTLPDSIQAYHIITYSSFNKVDFKQDFPNGVASIYGIDVNKTNLSTTLSDSKFVGTVNGNTLNFTLTLNNGQYVSAVSVK